jgi:hypothetical protein
MKFGVEINSKGEIIITDPNLYRYKDIYSSLLWGTLFKYMVGIKYRSSKWNVYEDPTFMDEITRVFENITEFLVSNNIFPVDILEPRPTKQIPINLVRFPGLRSFGIELTLNKQGVYQIPTSNTLLDSFSYIKQKPWVLIEKPKKLCRSLWTSTKKPSKRIAKKLWDTMMNTTLDETLIDSNLETIKTGISLELDTSLLSKYSYIRYVIETTEN